MSTDNKSVQSTAQIEDVYLSEEDRLHRAIILDSKLEDALLQSYQYMAEIVDHKLYKELGFGSAKEYFQTKQISVRQLYNYAKIGREFKPYLSDPKHKDTFQRLGTSKIGLIASKLSDQIDPFMQGGTIEIGDEIYTVDDIDNASVKQIEERLKSLSKKVEKNDLLMEQNKSLELEKKVLLKEQDDFKKRDKKYREVSEFYDEIERDIVDATEAFAEAQRLINRIDTSLVPKQLGPRLKLLIETIQNAGVDIAEMHSEVMFKYDEGL